MELVNVYLCYNSIEAQRARSILEEEGVEVTTHSLASTAFPVGDDANARMTLQVLEDQAANARRILHEAVKADVLTGDGHVVDADD